MMEIVTGKDKVRFGLSEKNPVMFFKTVEDLEAIGWSDRGMVETEMEKNKVGFWPYFKKKENLGLEAIGFGWTDPATKMKNKLRFRSSAKNTVRFFGPFLKAEESEIARRLATDRMIKGLMRLESMILGLESMMLGLDWLEKVVVNEYSPGGESIFIKDMKSGIVTLKMLIDEYTHMVVEAAGGGEEIFSLPLECETSSKYLEMYESFRSDLTHLLRGEEGSYRSFFLDWMLMEIDMLKRAVSKEYTHIPGCKDDQEPLVEGETAGINKFQEGMRSGFDMLKILICEYTYMMEGGTGTGDDGWPC